MSDIDGIIETYLEQNGLSSQYGDFCREIFAQKAPSGTIAYPGAGEDVFHPLLMGGDEITMIDTAYTTHTAQIIQEELLALGTDSRKLPAEGYDRIQLETGQIITLVPQDAATYTPADNYAGLLLKGAQKLRSHNIAQRYVDNVIPEGIIVAETISKTMQTRTPQSKGTLEMQFVSGSKGFVECGIYRK